VQAITFTVPALPVAQPRARATAINGMARKATDGQLLTAYSNTGSVWKVARQFGMCGQSVHERLSRLGVITPRNLWTPDDDKVLQERYRDYKSAGKLADLALQLGRTKPFICRQAKRLGLTSQAGDKPYARVWKGMEYEHAMVLFDAFKDSRLGLGQYCTKMGFDDLGFSRTMKEHFPDEWESVIEGKQPRQTKYRLGRQVEYRVRDHLKKLGYVAIRSPASKGPMDLIAVKPGLVLFIQCKRSMALGVQEWNEIYDLAMSVEAIPVLAGSPTGRGIVFKRLVARKDGSKSRQPFEDFTP
jgi:Holliday junction resolvase